MKKTIATVAVFLLCAAGIFMYARRPQPEPEVAERNRMRVVVPTGEGAPGHDAEAQERAALGNAYILKAPMEPGELVLSVLNFDFDNSGIDDQVVAFRAAAPQAYGEEAPVSIAFFSFSERTADYRRLWSLPTSATAPGTVSLFTLDLLGDRSNVIVVTGMNYQNEHTMTVFRRSPFNDPARPFDVIADIRIDGSVFVQETQRSLAYQQGIARGQPFNIVATGRDPDSENILDRIELTYAFNQTSGIYQRGSRARIPGARIEQDRVRHILSGAPGVFEGFVGDLWYHVSEDGTVDRSQLIFFDPARREVIFFGEENQQIFVWQSSNTTRQGIFITSHNSALTTMRRRVNVELLSLDSIYVTVTDERRQRIGYAPTWTGTYRRAGAIVRALSEEGYALAPHKDGVFDSPIGRLRFMPCGAYELIAHGSLSRGRHAFFSAGGMDLLELRPDAGYAEALWSLVATGGTPDARQVFHVTGISRNDRGRPDARPQHMSLSRVRFGATGAQSMHEAQIVLTRAEAP